MDDSIIAAVRAHAAQESPRECCGLVVKVDGVERYWPCRNVSENAAQFAIDPVDYAAAEDAGAVVAVCHSHPFASPEPSDADRVMCERSGLPWIICNHPMGHWRRIDPAGYRAPLIGRPFSHGILDCYGLLISYYLEQLNIALPDFDRPDDWWLKGGDLYRQHFAEAGFVAVEKSALRQHDVILMRIRAPVPNHCAIYLGDNKILHHLMDRPSGRTIYGGWLRSVSTHALRHKELMQ